MTRLLFLPNDQSFMLLDSPLPAVKTVKNVRAGQWAVPEPYGSLMAETRSDVSMQAYRHGDLVVVIPNNPLYLDLNSLHPHTPNNRPSGNFLTGRQTDVLQYMAEGLSTKEIALRMGLTTRTVLMHIAALKQRLNASTRAQAVMTAAALGLCKTVIYLHETQPERKPRSA